MQSQLPKPSTVSPQPSNEAVSGRCKSALAYPIENRTYEITSELDGIMYSWDDCSWLGIKCKRTVEKILFTNKACLQMFSDMDFVFAKRIKP